MNVTLANPSSVSLKKSADLDIGVIYTYEDDFLSALLPSLVRSGDGLSMRLILVDNSSRRGATKWESIFPATEIVRNATRLGYAANLNRILQRSSAPYILLLNTDMEFAPEEQCAAKMVRFMEAHPDCGIAGCRLYHGDRTYAHPARRFQTLKTAAARRLGMSGVFRDELRAYFYEDRSPMDSFDCDWLSGCFLMIRRQAFEDVGFLDAGFAKYFEDVDFCLRMQRAGWRVMFHGGTYCYHLEQRASAKIFSRDAWLHAQSYFRWLRKWGLQSHGRQQATPRQHRRAA